MKTEVDTSVTINGVKYVPESAQTTAKNHEGLDAVVIRSDRAGVFYGFIYERNGSEVVLLKSRRVFYWSGAASLSQLAIDGTSKPNDCKFPEALDRHIILGVIEIIPMTANALKSLDGVPVWKQ